MSTLELSEGTRLPEYHFERISRTTLALFAGASGDHNPIHIDIDVVRDAGMDDVFAHGMLSMAYLGRYVAWIVPRERIQSLATRFVAITPVNATPTCAGTVVDQRILDDGRRVADLELQMRLADGTVTLTGSATVLLCRTVGEEPHGAANRE